MPSAREVAAEVLVRVTKDQAYAAAALSASLGRSTLSEQDRGLATEICYGVLRTEPYLLRRLEAFGKLKRSDARLISHLLVAAYQIEFLDRVPARAAIFEGVQAITDLRGSKVGGFANAILRALADSSGVARMEMPEAILSSTPSWIRKRLLRDVGEAATVSLLVPARAPRPHLRLRVPAAELPWVQEKCLPCAHVTGSYVYFAGGDPRLRPGYDEGKFVVQELGAQLVAHALGAAPGERVLDVCAGRGQKAALLAEQVGSGGRVVATDLHAHKVRDLTQECARLGLSVGAETWDWTTPPPESFRGAFDRVLVDAPCSGLGTLRRRPEIARRLGPSDPARLAELQVRIAENAALAVRKGGVLLFATCSILAEEGEQVVTELKRRSEGMLVDAPIATAVDAALFTAGDAPDSASPDPGQRTAQLRLLPDTHGSDGYFIARLRRLESVRSVP